MGKGAQYKKPRKRKRYAKKDWIMLGAILGVLAVAVAAFLIVVNRGYVKVKDGVYQIAKDEIAANYGGDADARYKVIGTVGEIDGFALGDDSRYSLLKYLKPTGESNVKAVQIGGSAWRYDALAEKMSGLVASQYGIEAPAPVSAMIAGRAASYITYVSPGTADTDRDKADDSTPDEPVAMAYLDYDDGHCVFVQVIYRGEMPGADEIAALLEKIAGGLSLREP